jgi:hypothetical protein
VKQKEIPMVRQKGYLTRLQKVKPMDFQMAKRKVTPKDFQTRLPKDLVI